MSVARETACAAIESAIQAVAELTLDNDEVITDAVIVCGSQHIDDDGDRIGRVITFPRHGSQPTYISIGLLASATRLITAAEHQA